MKKFIIILLVSLIALSCSKSDLPDPCPTVRMFIDYYSIVGKDTILTGTDEWFPFIDNRICDAAERAKCKNSGFMGCPTGYRMIRYQIGNEISEPKIFK